MGFPLFVCRAAAAGLPARVLAAAGYGGKPWVSLCFLAAGSETQASIQGDAVRVASAKKDTLQETIALVRKSITDIPLQFKNFRE